MLKSKATRVLKRIKKNPKIRKDDLDIGNPIMRGIGQRGARARTYLPIPQVASRVETLVVASASPASISHTHTVTWQLAHYSKMCSR